MINSRKADATLWEVLLKVLMVIAVILLVFNFAGNIWDAIKPMSYDDRAKQQFDLLAQDVERLLEDDGMFLTHQGLYTSHKGFTIVGFDHDWMSRLSNVKHSTKDDSGPVIKPDACYEERGGMKRERACLCLYKGDIKEMSSKDSQAYVAAENFKDKNRNVVKCRIYQGKVVFLGMLSNTQQAIIQQYYEKDRGEKRLLPLGNSPKYEYLFLYSGKDNVFWDLYIEKYKADATYVYITKNVPEYVHMFDFFHICPEGSDQGCAGKQFFQSITFTGAGQAYPDSPEEDPGAANFVCEYDEESGVCKHRAYGYCGTEIYEPCLCQDQIRFSGTCLNNYYHDIDCAEINECKDYCKHEGCVFGGERLCEDDPCGKGCRISKVSGGLTDTVKCVSKG